MTDTMEMNSIKIKQLTELTSCFSPPVSSKLVVQF